MANPLSIITKPLSFAFTIGRGALSGAVDAAGRMAGGGNGQAPAAEPESRSQPAAASRRRAASPSRDRKSSSRPKPDIDDVALARKVETHIFRDDTVPKGKIQVNAADGVVWLRGEAKTPEMIKSLEAQAREIPEVRDVENLLHLPKTPAPTRTDTPRTQRKTRRSKAGPASRKVTSGRVTAERRSPRAEPSPKDRAAHGVGRTAAPLGAEGDSGEGGSGGGSSSA